MMRTVSRPDECRELWEAFSPHERAWDEWELMWAFHDEDGYRLNFLVFEPEGTPAGLLPLVQDLADSSFELFGGSYPDCRVPWVRPQDFRAVFDQLPEPVTLFDLRGPWVDEVLGQHPDLAAYFSEPDQRYFLQPADFDYDFTNHIATFSGDKRRGFLYDLRKIRQRDLEIEWSDTDASELFIRFSVQRFGAESDYNGPKGRAELRRVVSALRRKGCLRTGVIRVDGEPQAASLSAHYRGTLIALYAASNPEIKNLGKLLNVETIQEGCRLRVDEVNYMTGMQWKADWEMSAEPCCTLRKPPKAQPAG